MMNRIFLEGTNITTTKCIAKENDSGTKWKADKIINFIDIERRITVSPRI